MNKIHFRNLLEMSWQIYRSDISINLDSDVISGYVVHSAIVVELPCPWLSLDISMVGKVAQVLWIGKEGCEWKIKSGKLRIRTPMNVKVKDDLHLRIDFYASPECFLKEDGMLRSAGQWFPYKCDAYKETSFFTLTAISEDVVASTLSYEKDEMIEEKQRWSFSSERAMKSGMVQFVRGGNNVSRPRSIGKLQTWTGEGEVDPLISEISNILESEFPQLSGKAALLSGKKEWDVQPWMCFLGDDGQLSRIELCYAIAKSFCLGNILLAHPRDEWIRSGMTCMLTEFLLDHLDQNKQTWSDLFYLRNVVRFYDAFRRSAEKSNRPISMTPKDESVMQLPEWKEISENKGHCLLRFLESGLASSDDFWSFFRKWIETPKLISTQNFLQDFLNVVAVPNSEGQTLWVGPSPDDIDWKSWLGGHPPLDFDQEMDETAQELMQQARKCVDEEIELEDVGPYTALLEEIIEITKRAEQ